MPIVKIRKWGDSVGVVIPKEEKENLKLRPGDKVDLQIHKVTPIKDLFGIIKLKESSQKVKDELREEWGDD